MERPIQWFLDETGYGRAPVVAVDSHGRWWVAWIAWSTGGESLRLRCRASDGSWSDPVDCVRADQITAVAMTAWREGVAVAWVDGPDLEGDGLKLCRVDPSGVGPTMLVVPGRRRPAYPEISSDSDSLGLTWTTREAAGRRLESAVLTDIREDFESTVLSPRGGFHIFPKAVFRRGDLFVVWQEMSKRGGRILSRTLKRDGGILELRALSSDSDAIAALPSVARDTDDGIWAAWQTDHDQQRGTGLVRWIELVHIDADGRLSVPAHPMKDVDRGAKGVDQGFESPSLAVLDDRRLVIIGRGSQSLRRQYLGRKGWSPREQIDEPGWACRGRRFNAVSVKDGVFVVGREGNQITARFLPSGDSSYAGPPELVPAPPVPQELVSTPPSRLSSGFEVAGQRVLFGDIHQHTMISDGTGTAEETMQRARYRYHDDLVALADHESFLGKRTPPGQWREACRVADEGYEPGAFVTLQAYEWTGKMHPGPGHKVVYLPPEGGPLWSREDPPSETSEGLMTLARRHGALVFPHHVGWTGADMEHHDPQVQTCWEIVSCHGAYERPGVGPIGTRGDDKDGQFVGDALDKGLRFGFVGGSDGHGLNWHHGVSRVRDSHRTGLTAVFAEEVSREGVLEALRRRRCYATSGAKIGLWFEIDGRPMGEEIFTGSPVPFRIVARCTDPIETIALVSNQGLEISLEASGTAFEIRGTVEPPSSEVGWCYYYVRLVQQDGQVAWSSPIWLESPKSA